jgi:hypothetical protein
MICVDYPTFYADTNQVKGGNEEQENHSGRHRREKIDEAMKAEKGH